MENVVCYCENYITIYIFSYYHLKVAKLVVCSLVTGPSRLNFFISLTLQNLHRDFTAEGLGFKFQITCVTPPDVL